MGPVKDLVDFIYDEILEPTFWWFISHPLLTMLILALLILWAGMPPRVKR